MKIYKDQFFRLTLDTGIDLTEATALKIKYTDPEGATGEWTGAIDADDNTKINYDSSGLTKVGRWKVYAKATFSTGNIPGDAAYFDIYEEGI